MLSILQATVGIEQKLVDFFTNPAIILAIVGLVLLALERRFSDKFAGKSDFAEFKKQYVADQVKTSESLAKMREEIERDMTHLEEGIAEQFSQQLNSVKEMIRDMRESSENQLNGIGRRLEVYEHGFIMNKDRADDAHNRLDVLQMEIKGEITSIKEHGTVPMARMADQLIGLREDIQANTIEIAHLKESINK